MNIFLFTDSDEIAPGEIRISGRRFEHLTGVLGMEVGGQLRVGELNGELGLGTVLDIGDSAATIGVELNRGPPRKLPLSLVLALPRPKMLRRILRTVAELGVSELHLINSYRVEKSYWSTPALSEETVQQYFIQGLEQARDTVLPRLDIHHRFKPFVEDRLPALMENRRSLAAHPGEYPNCPRGLAEDTLLIIGPEGGFIPYEVEKLQQAGCELVSLGRRILRVETAVSSIIGRLF